jgi:hypothetical protein
MKKLYIAAIIFLFTLTSCKAQVSLSGEWKIVDLKNIIHIDKEDLEELRKKCVGANVEIGKSNITVKSETNCDFKGCNEVKLTPITLKVIDANEENRKYPGQEIYNGEIGETFLKFIDYKNPERIIKAYDTNCNISWGDEPLKIIPVEKNTIIFLVGSYILKLEKAE